MVKYCSIDIDGVLNNYPQCWLDYIEEIEHKKFATIAEARNQLGNDRYGEIKHRYRTEGRKTQLPINEAAKQLLKQLKENGFTIIISTSRPFNKYTHLEQLTFDWLKNNGFHFDFLRSKTPDLIREFYPILFHLDDEIEHASFYLQNNIHVFLIERVDLPLPENHLLIQHLTVINNVSEVFQYLQGNAIN